jgi:predicted  nucleic acid-binding Zn-ribbon protein
MMNDLNIKNLIIAAAVVVGALVILGFVSTLITTLLPLTIVAVIAFILGRMSADTNLLSLGTNLFKRASENINSARSQAKTEAKPAKTSTTTSDVNLTSRKERLSEKEKPDDSAGFEKDFAVRSQEEILAAARRREQEIINKSKTDYDAMAAIEERKRRLKGE